MDYVGTGESSREGSAINPAGEFFLALLVRLGRWKRGIVIVVMVPTLAAAAVSLIISPKFDSTATVMPVEESKNLSLGTELGGLPGLPLNLADRLSQHNTTLYPAILRSRTISGAILAHQFEFQFDGRQVRTNLMDWWELDDEDEAVRTLGKIVTIFLDPNTGIIRISARTRSPNLSPEIVNRYLQELDNFNNHVRTSRAIQTLEFTEKRLGEVKGELLVAEQDLKSFQERNRNYFSTTDPDLLLELGRLQRQVELKNQLFITLSNQYEINRIQAKKDIPIIQVLDYGEPPVKKSTPRRKFIVISVFIISFMTIMFLAMLYEIFLSLPAAVRDRLRSAALLFLPKRLNSGHGSR